MHGLIRQTGKGCRFECCFLPIKNTNNDINFLYLEINLYILTQKNVRNVIKEWKE